MEEDSGQLRERDAVALEQMVVEIHPIPCAADVESFEEWAVSEHFEEACENVGQRSSCEEELQACNLLFF